MIQYLFSHKKTIAVVVMVILSLWSGLPFDDVIEYLKESELM